MIIARSNGYISRQTLDTVTGIHRTAVFYKPQETPSAYLLVLETLIYTLEQLVCKDEEYRRDAKILVPDYMFEGCKVPVDSVTMQASKSFLKTLTKLEKKLRKLQEQTGIDKVYSIDKEIERCLSFASSRYYRPEKDLARVEAIRLKRLLANGWNEIGDPNRAAG
jgi:hypothetical protein